MLIQIAAMVGAVAALLTFGSDYISGSQYRPAMLGEVQEVIILAEGNKRELLRQEITRLRTLIYEINRDIDQAEKVGQVVPRVVWEDKANLELRLEDLVKEREALGR